MTARHLTVVPDPPTDDELAVLHVARAHGTAVAADWSGRSRSYVVRLRKDFDGYDRGRGRSSLAEIAAMAPRLSCTCPRCVEWRAEEMSRSNHRHASTAGGLDDPDPSWRAQAACSGRDPKLWHPDPRGLKGYDYRAGLEVCHGECHVQADCLRFALRNGLICDGVYGGLNPTARRKLRRLVVAAGALLEDELDDVVEEAS